MYMFVVQKSKCDVLNSCSRPFRVLLSPYVGARRRGLGSETSFLCVHLCLKNQMLFVK